MNVNLAQETKFKLLNYEKALQSLEEALSTPVLSNRDRAGIIQNFEFVYETCWKALKAFLSYEGKDVKTPREAFSESYASGFLKNEEVWLAILKDRNLTVQTYDQEMSRKIFDSIVNSYAPVFRETFDFLNARAKQP